MIGLILQWSIFLCVILVIQVIQTRWIGGIMHRQQHVIRVDPDIVLWTREEKNSQMKTQ